MTKKLLTDIIKQNFSTQCFDNRNAKQPNLRTPGNYWGTLSTTERLSGGSAFNTALRFS